jgi:hypothetical protein
MSIKDFANQSLPSVENHSEIVLEATESKVSQLDRDRARGGECPFWKNQRYNVAGGGAEGLRFFVDEDNVKEVESKG